MSKLGLRGKSTLFVVGMAISLGLVLGGSGYFQLRKHQIAELERWGLSTAEALARNASYALFTEDVEALTELATDTLRAGDVRQVSLSNAEGVLLAWGGEAALSPSALKPPAEPVLLTRSVQGGRFFEIRVPVDFFLESAGSAGALDEGLLDFDDGFPPEEPEDDAGQAPATSPVVGQVALAVSHARVEALLSGAWRTTVVTTLAIMGLAGLLATLYMRRVVEPLTRMTEVARHMADGDFSRDFDTSGGSDEVTTLARAFGSMKEAVREHTEQVFRSKMEELSMANEEVMRANAELLSVNRRKSAFLADMSHELRTPLNAIIGFSDMLKEGLLGELTEEQADVSGDILSSGRHLLTLINDILDIAKIEAGKAELELGNVTFPELVEEVTTSARGLAYQKGLELEVDLDESIGVIRADGRRLKQVLLNLLSNAVKYTPAGKVRLEARREAEQADAFEGAGIEYLRVSVQDTGVGIDDKDRDRVFSEFDRVDNQYSRKQEGTGLGLALGRKLVELHGGTIDFTSTPGVGSDFFFRIPLEPAEATAMDSVPPPPRGDGPPPLVLVVEDDRSSANVVCRTLKAAGYRVELAGSAAEAVVMTKELLPDVVTLDVRLPDQDGWSVLRELRASESTRDIPVVMMSGVDAEAKGLDLGASAYLLKPVKRETFLSQIGTVMKRKARGTLVAIDDDATMRQWYEKALTVAGWRVHVSPTGPEGLELVRRVRPDLVVLDLMMSGVDGFEVLRQLRADPELGETPVCVVTAKDLNAEESALLKGDVERILQKGSFNSRELVRDLLAFRPVATTDGDPAPGAAAQS